MTNTNAITTNFTATTEGTLRHITTVSNLNALGIETNKTNRRAARNELRKLVATGDAIAIPVEVSGKRDLYWYNVSTTSLTILLTGKAPEATDIATSLRNHLDVIAIATELAA